VHAVARCFPSPFENIIHAHAECSLVAAAKHY